MQLQILYLAFLNHVIVNAELNTSVLGSSCSSAPCWSLPEPAEVFMT